MKFASINMLFLIWAVPVLLLFFLYGQRRRVKILKKYASTASLKIIAPNVSNQRRWFKTVFLIVSVIFIAIALSGPQYGFHWQEIEQKGIDIFIALDCSKSMLADDIKPNRLERAKREVYDLLSMLRGDRAGLVAFAGAAFVQCPLTLDYQAFNIFMNALNTEYLPVGGTDIAGAINAAIEGFPESEKTEKAIIIITDGENTGGDAFEAAKQAAKVGVKVFCIGVGKSEGIPVPEKDGGFKKDKNGKIILTKLDENTLIKIADITGGAYVRSVAGDMDLENIYLKSIRGELEQSTLKSGKKKIWEDRYQWPLGFAIFMLVIMLLIPSTIKKNGNGGKTT